MFPRTKDEAHTRAIVRENITAKNVITIEENSETKQGNIRVIKVKRVCKTCNGGWMGTLEEEVRPILTPMILCDHSTINERDQGILSRWIIKTIMVSEFVNETDVVSTEQDRKTVMDGRCPLGKWKIWLINYRGQKWWMTYRRHSVLLSLTESKPEGAFAKNVQDVLFGLGGVLVYAINSPVDLGFDLQGDIAPAVQKIWPIESIDIKWPISAPINDSAADRLAHALSRQLRRPNVRHVPDHT